jgi:hypothetical protein
MTLFYGEAVTGEKLLSFTIDGTAATRDLIQNAPALSETGVYRWETESRLNPVKQTIGSKSMHDLCKAFPKNTLRHIQPVLKTGNGLLEERLTPHLEGVSACLGDDLLIVSDVDLEVGDYVVIDVLSDLRPGFVRHNKQLKSYVIRKELADNDKLLSGSTSAQRGWKTDKFKFLPQVSRAWQMRPGKKWYVFYEDDTYIVWDNIFRLLEHFDPDTPWYFGSPSPGARGIWMANGGPGYVISREAVRRLVKDDYDGDGTYRGSILSQRWEKQVMQDCCGDSVLGLALHEDAQTSLSGLFPMFQPHALHSIPLSDEYWCQPIISMHKTAKEDMVLFRKWEESRRSLQRPLVFADLIDYLNLTEVPFREDWINSDFGGYRAPVSEAHASFYACGRACQADHNCLQWTYHLRTCDFVSSIRLGHTMVPGTEPDRSHKEKDVRWSHQEKRYLAGWDLEGIKRWTSAAGRDCQNVGWEKPSLKRI